MTVQREFRTNLVVGKQAAKGTLATSGHVIRHLSNGLVGDREKNYQATIHGNRSMDKPTDGAYVVNAGAIVMPLDAEAVGYFFAGMFGDASTASAAGWITHTWTPTTTEADYWTFERRFADLAEYEKFQDCKVTAMNLAWSGGGPQNISFTVDGVKATMSNASFHAAAAEVSNATLFNLTHAAMTWGGSSPAGVTGLELNLNTGMEKLPVTLGNDGKAFGFNEGMSAASGTVTLIFDSDDEYDDAVASTEKAMVLTFTNGNRVLAFTMDEVELGRPDLSTNGPDGAKLATFPFTAHYDDGATGAAFKIELTNQIAGY